MFSPESLTTARQALQSPHIPLILRATYYLRISCLHLNSSSLSYSSLMEALYTQNPTWIATLSITPAGYLQSSDRAINKLLLPITALHQTTQFTEMALPAVA